MKAVQVKAYGGPEVLEIISEVTPPTPKDNQILVDVKSVSINPFDVIVRNGFLKDKMPLELPYVPGGDFSGIVSGISSSETGFKVGDEVYGQAIIFNGGSGTFAETCTANIANTALKPKNIDFIEAGVLPLVGASAIQAIDEHIALKAGQKILVHGGAGGIGHIAVQLAKIYGAHVATTVSAEDMEFARSLGADEIIDYKNQIFEDVLREYDAVFDTVGGDVTTRSLSVLKKNGILVSMKGAPDQTTALTYNVKVIGQATLTSSARLNMLTRFIENGKIKVNVNKVFTLDETREAFVYFENTHFTGKVAVKVN